MSQHPPVHHPKNPLLGFHGWDETVPQRSVYLVSRFFFLGLLFSYASFSSLTLIFFLGLFFLLVFFFVPPSLNPSFFLGTPTYSSNLPTSLPPPNPSTSPYLPHQPFALPSIASTTESFWSLWRASRACKKLRELGELVELGMQNIKRSFHLEAKCFFSCFFLLLPEPRRRVAAHRLGLLSF